MYRKTLGGKLSALSSILLLLAIAGAVNANKKFSKGYIEFYPLATSLPAPLDDIPTTPHTEIVPIQGTVNAKYHSYDWTDVGKIEFKIYFRELPDATYKDSLVIEFSIPYPKKSYDYRNNRDIFSTSSQDPMYLIKKEDIKIFNLENDFQIFKGEEISDKVKLKIFKTDIIIRKVKTREKRRRGYRTRISYVPVLRLFDLYFEKGDQLERMVIDTKSIEEEDQKRVMIVLLVVGYCALIFPFLIICLPESLSKKLSEAQEDHEFIGSLITIGFWPFNLLPAFKYTEGTWEKFVLLILILWLGLLTVTSSQQLARLFQQENVRDSTKFIVGLACALNLWWILTLFFQNWLLLHSFFFFAGIFCIDLFVVYSNNRMKSWKILVCSLIACLIALFVEIFYFSIYVFKSFEAYAEVPEVWIRFVLPDLGVFLGLMVLAAVVGSFKGSSGRNRYRRQIEM